MRVAVVGAGIVGASVALRLAEGGAEVALIDAAEPASGTTSKSFAWVNANNKTPRSYFDLNFAGMEEHARLQEELVGDWLHQTGNVILADEAGREDLEGRVERLLSWGYSAQLLSAGEAEGLEPEVSFPNQKEAAAHFPEESWLDAPRLTRKLVRAAKKNGVKTFFGRFVREIEPSGGRVTVYLKGGGRFEANAVVNACGPQAKEVAALVGRNLPLDVFRGLLVRVSAPGNLLRGLLHTPRVNLRPDGPGHVLLHHDSVDKRLTENFAGAEDPLCGELLERAGSLVPALEGSSVVEARFGLRPVPGDGYSCVGGVPGLPGYFEAVTHSGVTLGPLVGRLLAKEILSGEVDPLLEPFRPGRFGGRKPG